MYPYNQLHKRLTGKKSDKKKTLVSCYNYMDKKNMIQRRCTCGPSNTSISARRIVYNGCGPSAMGQKQTVANQFLHKQTVVCCMVHDGCMGQIVDTGVWANEFSTCLNKVPDYSLVGKFRRNVLAHMVQTSSSTFLKQPSEYTCTPIQKPKLKTMQTMYQHEVWSLLRKK